MKMKMRFLLVASLALASTAGLWAQATKVAVIDMQRAIGETKEGQAQIADLEKKYSPKQAEFQKRSSDIQAKTDQLKKMQNTASDEAKATLDGEITRLKTALQRDLDDAQQDSDADQQALQRTVGAKVYQVVQKYAADNQIMMVFDLSSQPNNLICCAAAPDITAAVIALYDKANVGGAASAPAPTATKPAPTATTPRPAGTTQKPAGTTPAK